jgi:hypothetical protein
VHQTVQDTEETALAPKPVTATQTEQKRNVVRGHILFTFAVMLALALAWKLRDVLEIVYVSALFAVVLMPVVQQIMRVNIRGWQPVAADRHCRPAGGGVPCTRNVPGGWAAARDSRRAALCSRPAGTDTLAGGKAEKAADGRQVRGRPVGGQRQRR